MQKYSYLPHWICNDQRFEIYKKLGVLTLVFNKVNGCFEKINKTNYLNLVPTNESKEKQKI